ncbi:hypothetical protein OPV22_035236 [Ensete ventricosum]|uniref:Uncharacterized protein n=1 Tax=Ensete ventricosum TaxID=4639 RepID=A0AAX5NIG1_ENSVE|nr:hypothetical protein OPV22_035236 [Ensete ventricosum]
MATARGRSRVKPSPVERPVGGNGARHERGAPLISSNAGAGFGGLISSTRTHASPHLIKEESFKISEKRQRYGGLHHDRVQLRVHPAVNLDDELFGFPVYVRLRNPRTTEVVVAPANLRPRLPCFCVCLVAPPGILRRFRLSLVALTDTACGPLEAEEASQTNLGSMYHTSYKEEEEEEEEEVCFQCYG